MNEWKEASNKRRERRQAKELDDPPRHKKSRKNKKRIFRLESRFKEEDPLFGSHKEWSLWQAYETFERANQAKKQKEKTFYGKLNDWRIVPES
jgi:hypothetical protein